MYLISEAITNGNSQELNGFAKSVHSILHPDDFIDSGPTNVDLERNDSDKNSKGKDSGIEVKDSFRSNTDDVEQVRQSSVVKRGVRTRNSAAEIVTDEVFDSDGSEMPERTAHVQEVRVQIEEPSRQNQLPSITASTCDEKEDTVSLKSKKTFSNLYKSGRMTLISRSN